MVNVFLLRLIVLLIFSYGPIPESFSLFSYSLLSVSYFGYDLTQLWVL